MITEDYVSFEIAKLLKEKGFDEICLRTYFEDGKLSRIFTENEEICNRNILPSIVSASTLQMAMKWLREVHNIFIQIALYSKLGDYCFEVFQNINRLIVEEDEVYDTYEQACEAAIKYCLKNLI